MAIEDSKKYINNKKKKGAPVIPFIFVTTSIVLIFLYFFNPPQEASFSSTAPGRSHTKDYQNRVNKHLVYTDIKMRIDKQKTAMENNKAPKAGDSVALYKEYRPESDFENHGLGSQETRAIDVYNDINTRGKMDSTSPDYNVQQELWEKQKQSEYDEAYREAYVSEFIANAKKNGYIVKVNDKMVVTSVVPIPGFHEKKNLEGTADFSSTVGGSAR